MDVDDLWWAELVRALESIAEVAAREPHGLVTRRGNDEDSPVTVEIVMTPDEWDELVGIMWGSAALAAEHVRDLVLEQPSDRPYLVYGQYELIPCAAAELPEDPDLARLKALAAQYPGGVIPGAGWYAYPPDQLPTDRERPPPAFGRA